jgi:hypothetical protein
MMTRRKFVFNTVGWSVGIGWIASIGGAFGLYRRLRSLNSEKHAAIATEVDAAGPLKRARRRKHSRKERRQAYRKLKTWAQPTMVLSTKMVVHWPNPTLYKTRYLVKKSIEQFPPCQWQQHFEQHTAKHGPAPRGGRSALQRLRPTRSALPGIHFMKVREGPIRENLALASLKVDEHLNVSNIDNAIAILRPIVLTLTLPFNQRNLSLPADCTVKNTEPVGRTTAIKSDSERYFFLYARLLCLKHENNPRAAMEELFQSLGLQLIIPNLKEERHPNRHSRLASFSEDPKGFFARTIDRSGARNSFRSKLARRVRFATIAMGGCSSSGQDTLMREGSSTLPQHSLQTYRHRHYLPRRWRCLRRKLGRKFRRVLSRRQRRSELQLSRRG